MINILETTSNGVEITTEMVAAFCERFNVENVESNQAGVVGSIVGWTEGKGELDAYLCDSPEMRELFAGVRKAYFAALEQEEPAYSNVSWEDRPKPDADEKGEGAEGSEGAEGAQA